MPKFQPFGGTHPGDPLHYAESGICGVLDDFLDARQALIDQELSVREYLKDHPEKAEKMRGHLEFLRAEEKEALGRLCLAAAIYSCHPDERKEQVRNVLGVETTAIVLDD